MQGLGPLIAASPSRHEPIPMLAGIDVQQFHQNAAAAAAAAAGAAVWAPIPVPHGAAPTEPPTLESQTPFQQLVSCLSDRIGSDRIGSL